MSWKATAAVKEICEGITRSEKMLLLILAECHNAETGRCTPSVRYLAKYCLMSERQAVRLLASLETRGFISTEQRFGRDGRQTSNAYTLPCIRGDTMSGGRVKSDVTQEGELAVSPEPEEGTGRRNHSVPSERATEPPPIVRFYRTSKTNEQAAALVDIAKDNGFPLDGGHTAGMLARHPSAAVLGALMTAIGQNAARLDTRMEVLLKGGKDAKAGRSATGGQIPTGQVDVKGLEDRW